jgi:hypothetical protein
VSRHSLVGWAAAIACALGLSSVARADLDPRKWREATEKLEAALAAGDEKQAAAWLREVAKDDSERAAKLVSKALARFPESLDAYRAMDAVVGALSGERATRALRDEACAARDWRVRVLLFDALARRGAIDATTLARALADKQEEVQLSAVREVGRAKTIAGIEALCQAMAKMEAKGGLRGVVWQAGRNVLVRVLGVEREGGQDFRNYLDDHRAEFVEGKGLPAAAAAPGGRRAEEKGQTVALFGQEIHCRNVVLILDVSGSMDIPDPTADGPSTVLRDPTQNEIDPERRRINRAKKELKKVLEGLARAKARVNVIAYSTDVTAWKPEGLHELTAENLRTACAFVDGFKADGVTATDSALEWAFANAPGADCFYLISDGFATHDGTSKIPSKRIVDEVNELNRIRHVQINTLGFISPFGTAPGADPELMQMLADATGGTYAEIK